MNMRKIITGLAITTVILGSASSAMAWGHGNNQHMGRQMNTSGCGGECYNNDGGHGMMQGLSPEKQQQFQSMLQAHAQAMEPKRQQMQAKRLELDALAGNPNVKPETITRLSEEIAQLSSDFRQARHDLRTKMQAEFGNEPGFNRMGRGMMGRHGGHGMMGRGY